MLQVCQHTFLPRSLQSFLFSFLLLFELNVLLCIFLLVLLGRLSNSLSAHTIQPLSSQPTFNGFSFPPCRLDMIRVFDGSSHK